MDGESIDEKAELSFGRWVIPSKRLGWGIVVLVVIVGGSITLSTTGVLNGFLAGVIAAAGAAVGLLFQPLPKPADHSAVATASVQRMFDLERNLARAQETVSGLARECDDPTTKLRLILAQDILLEQNGQLYRVVNDWDQVSPGVAANVRKNLDAGKHLFALLKNGESIDR